MVDRKPKDKRSRSKSKPSKPEDRCGRCGYANHPPDKACSAKDKSCKKCGKSGHFSSVCRSKAPANESGQQQPGKRTDGKIGGIRVHKIEVSRRAPTTQISITTLTGPKKTAIITAVPDSGAEATVAGLDVLHTLGLDMNRLEQRGTVNLQAANRTPIESLGKLDVEIELMNRRTRTAIFFCADQDGMLLSWFTSKELGILSQNYPAPAPLAVNKIAAGQPTQTEIDEAKRNRLSEFSDVFDTSGPLQTMAGPA